MRSSVEPSGVFQFAVDVGSGRNNYLLCLDKYLLLVLQEDKGLLKEKSVC